ncbi:OLC1v1038109C1 [Oldenlandia corymbosa var. corymbosa]|uniref:OLC1v1038109C1 n=1 Tax=Oldenlandia corymbosa var. corymbosa TaxID=529605 RepID=A0AAV1D2S5_OLDCO|nr:OLC1v1038109C1 [Oldenlandia corymbosa var. corymbosa]
MAFEQHQVPAPVASLHRKHGMTGDVNSMPPKKPKVEMPELPIPAIPVSSYNPFVYRNQQLSSPWSAGPPVPRVQPFQSAPTIPPADKNTPVQMMNAATVNSEPNLGVRRFRPALRVVHPQPNTTTPGTECNNNASATGTARPLPPPKPASKTGAECISEKRFWKAGDYEGAPSVNLNWEALAGSDHIRVHPRFLHSNATSHKWVLGAFAELMDNSIDEARNGATFVNIDVIKNKKSGDRMLVIEDDGGGMNPQRMRECMSLGYSSKSKMANTIGQYGNGFKTSTMRLGADVIVFSRFPGKDGNNATQSVGLLSYTFLRCTKKEDIEVPMLDYERKGQSWTRIVRATSSPDQDWNNKIDTVVQWSPFSSEADLLEQFNDIKGHGTRIFIYNLWDCDEGVLELDFDSDPYDIQTRGREEKESNIQMAQQYPNSKHFLTYQYSLRSYASILYLKLPKNFRMILRGKEVDHHNIVEDMMMIQRSTYRPQQNQDSNAAFKDYRLVADVAVGFVKDAKYHIDVQGFNVYHKNRLIKPFWRVWNPAGSDGRGVIGVLEADFIEPAHDKQGFERTEVLNRLVLKLKEIQRNYWKSRCQEIGYAPRRNKGSASERDEPEDEPANNNDLNVSAPVSGRMITSTSNAVPPISQNGNTGNLNVGTRMMANNVVNDPGSHCQNPLPTKTVKQEDSVPRIDDHRLSLTGIMSNHHGRPAHLNTPLPPKFQLWKNSNQVPPARPMAKENNNVQKPTENKTNIGAENTGAAAPQRVSLLDEIKKLRAGVRNLREENWKLREEVGDLKGRLKMEDGEILGEDPVKELEAEKNKSKSLETQLLEANRKIEELVKERETATRNFEELKKGLETLRNLH